MHVLEQIEIAIAGLVAGTPTAGGTVYRNRARAWPKGTTGVNVMNTGDELTSSSGSSSGVLELRAAEYEIEIKTPKATPELAMQTVRDALAEITTAITSAVGLGIGTGPAYLTSADLENEATGSSNAGTVTAQWTVEYQIEQTDPQTLIP